MLSCYNLIKGSSHKEMNDARALKRFAGYYYWFRYVFADVSRGVYCVATAKNIRKSLIFSTSSHIFALKVEVRLHLV